MSDLTTLKNFSIIQIFKKNSNTFYYERKNKMKKIISAIIATAMMFTLCVTSTFAAESWREAFVTRLMKIMSSDPSYNQVVLTDLDRNGIPEIPIHVSTQANNINYRSAIKWYKMGATRVVLAREMSFKEIAEFQKKIPEDLELEAFIHGAMCISYSGRCLLSNYMTGRDSNMGACAHPCRWNYKLVEETRPGEYMDVFENERGTFIFNSKDLCTIRHIPELVQSGIASLKIEGRVKTSYYVATVVGAYRREIDRYCADPENYVFNEAEYEELCKVSHRPYTTGFYFGKPDENSQVYTSSSYIRDYDLIGIVKDYDEKTGIATITQRNRFFKGDEIEIIQPMKPFFVQTVESMCDENGNEIEVANHAEQIVKFKTAQPVCEGAMLRKKK